MGEWRYFFPNQRQKNKNSSVFLFVLLFLVLLLTCKSSNLYPVLPNIWFFPSHWTSGAYTEPPDSVKTISSSCIQFFSWGQTILNVNWSCVFLFAQFSMQCKCIVIKHYFKTALQYAVLRNRKIWCHLSQSAYIWLWGWFWRFGMISKYRCICNLIPVNDDLYNSSDTVDRFRWCYFKTVPCVFKFVTRKYIVNFTF